MRRTHDDEQISPRRAETRLGPMNVSRHAYSSPRVSDRRLSAVQPQCLFNRRADWFRCQNGRRLWCCQDRGDAPVRGAGETSIVCQSGLVCRSAGGRSSFDLRRPSAEVLKVPILTNPKHELFAQGLAQGSTARAAYVQARYKAFDASAWHLSKIPKLQLEFTRCPNQKAAHQ